MYFFIANASVLFAKIVEDAFSFNRITGLIPVVLIVLFFYC